MDKLEDSSTDTYRYIDKVDRLVYKYIQMYRQINRQVDQSIYKHKNKQLGKLVDKYK